LDSLILSGGCIAAVVLSIVWLLAARGRASVGMVSIVLDWLAASVLTVLLGGGVLMFGVAMLVFFASNAAATVGLAVAWVVIVASPFLVALLQYRGRRARRTG
jgi:hypothetical protein